MDLSRSKEVLFHKKETTRLERFEIIANTFNHGLIAITTFYIAWYCYQEGFDTYQHYHTFFSTIECQLFMSEGIMAMYCKNSYTMSLGNRQSKIWIHIILQVIGGGFVMFAIPYHIIKRAEIGRPHFIDTHGILGKYYKIIIFDNDQ